MGIVKNWVVKAGQKAGDKVSALSQLSPAQLSQVQALKDKYMTEMPDPAKDPQAVELTARLMAENGVQIYNSSVLSFNEKEDDAVTFAQIFRTLKNVNNIPFAMDPFGNVFCYNTIDNVVVFYNHEVNRFERTNMGFKKFISSLHA